MAIIRICVLFLFWLPAHAAYAGIVDVAAISETRSLLSEMRYLEDPSSDMTLEQVLDRPDWQPLTRSNHGYRKHPVWTMIRLTNSAAEPEHMILRNPRPGLNCLDVYLISDKHPIRSLRLGSLRPVGGQSIISRHSTVVLDILPEERITVATRIQSIGPYELDWKLSGTAEFSRYNLNSYLLFGFFGGLAITLILYNLSVWRSLRDPAYLLYSAMALFSLLFQYALNGIFRVLDMGLPPLLIFASGYITSSLFLLAMITFPILFFKTIRTMPRMHRILIILAGISVMMILLNVAYPMGLFLNFWAPLMGGFLLLTAFLLVILGIRATLLGLPGAWYYLAGQGFYQMAIVLQWATITGWIRLTETMEYFIILATMLDIAFLSFALGSRIKSLSEEKSTYQTLSLAQSRFTSVGKAVGMIIHQWKAPMARLGTQITELRGYLAHADAGPLEFAKRTARILPSMERDLQDMGRTIDEFGKFYAAGDEKELFNPRQIIDDVLELLKKKITAAKAEIFFNGEWNTLRLNNYPRYFSHVIMTIIDNALDILAERNVANAQIRLRLQAHGKFLTLIIEDNGGGIRVNPISEVFFPFVSHKTSKGSGLGLPIAKMVNEEHLNGTISAENTRRGARFTITVPGLVT
jgi:two-component system, sensor histidine kinase LadS